MSTKNRESTEAIEVTEVKVRVMLGGMYEGYVEARKKAGLEYSSQQKFCEAFVNDILDRYLSKEYMDPDFYDLID